MSLIKYAIELEKLAKQFENGEITYEQYINECDALGEIEIL